MKRLIVAILLSIFLLTGCDSKEQEILSGQFVVIESNEESFIHSYRIYDKQTRVIYIFTKNSWNGSSTMSPLYNADGTLQIYEEDK